ncbi:MAG: protein phosphatase, partial [Frankiales bacterium]|nr:protein phosphatase [Frankiales bacterium]
MVAPIDPEQIPTPKLSASWLQNAAWWLRADAGKMRLAGVDIRAGWQRLGSVYSAPEAGQLLAVMDPVRTLAGTVADNVEAAAAALERFAQEAGPLAAKLQDLQFQAQDFRRRLRSVEHWDHHSTLVAENNGYLWAVDQAVAAYEAAERDCANAIERLIGGAAFHAGGDPARDARSYGVDAIPKNAATPWGDPAKTRKSWLGSVEGALSVFNPVADWDGKLDVARGQWSAVVGMGEGLASLTPVLGWDRFTQTWDGVATMTGLHGPLPALAANWAMIKSTVDWDEWATDPARASGKTGVNVVSLAIPFAGEASALADLSRAGRSVDVTEIADNAAKAAKGGTTVAAAARIEEFARLTRLGEGIDPNLVSQMHRAGALDNMISQKFGDLTTANSPA